MAGESSLERALTRRAKLDTEPDAPTLKKSFDWMKEYLEKHHYPWVQANCPYFTDHGQAHIAAVINSASELTQDRLGLKRTDLSALDIYLILTAILWHDVGMVVDRATHANLVYKMTDDVSEFFPNPTVQSLVSQIASAHKGSTSLDKLPNEDYCTINGPAQQINPAMLASIVRFADEISENHTRASGQVLDTVPDKQKIFWLYALSVSSCTAQPKRERVVIDYRFDADRVVSRWPDREFEEFRSKDDQTIDLLTYALCRLEKVNNEREYCLRYFSSVATIREVIVRFAITRGGRQLPGYETHTTLLKAGGVESAGYPSIKIVEDFYTKHPQWKIEAIEGAIRT
jgi:hypothetical protein